MTFLSPLYLFGLVLAGIPTLIHLLSQRRLEKIPFSFLPFLASIEKTRMKWWRVRQILLLLMRTLALLCFALALAKPVLKGVALPGSGVSTPSSVCIILDNSFSMGRSWGEEEAFEGAKERARQLTEGLRAGDEVHFILSSDHPELPLGEPTRDLGILRRYMRDAHLSFYPTDHLAALRTAGSYLASSRTLNRSIYLITDMQRLGFRSLSKEGLDLDPDIGLSVLEIGKGLERNVSVDRVEFLDELLIPSEALELRAEIRNHGGRAETTLVSLFVNGMRKGAVEAQLGPGEAVSLPLSYGIESPGDQVGWVELEDPFLRADNRRYFSLHIPERIEVLLVDGGDPSRPGASESYYPAKALSPGGGLTTFFHPERIPWDELPGKDLRRYAVVALLNGGSFSREVGERLRGFVRDGGGLLVALGERTHPASYRDLLSQTSGPSVGELSDTMVKPSEFLTVSEADYTSPILSPFRDPSRGDLSLPRFYKVFPQEGGKVLARLSDGSPLLVEGGIGSGRVICAAVPFTRGWSDLPVKGIFVPLIHRLFSYLSKERGGRLSASVGGDLSLELREHPRSLSLVRPAGEEVPLEPEVGVGSISVKVTGFESPGTYRVLGDGRQVVSFAVNSDPEESDISRLADEELTQILPQARLVREDEAVEVAITHWGSELRGPLLFLTLLFLLGEMVIGFRRPA